MKTQHPKLKTPPRPLFSCGFFRYCTQHVLSPTTPQTPTLPPPPPPPPPHSHDLPAPATDPSASLQAQQESESSSSSASHSFTQWRFPLPTSPLLHQPLPELESSSDLPPETAAEPDQPPPMLSSSSLAELFHLAELQFTTGSESSQLSALQLLERSLVPNPPANGSENRACPPAVMRAVVGFLKHPAGAKPATKVLLALCLAEENRHLAVEAGAVAQVVETVAELEGAAAERELAALELLCTVPEGAAELRSHALAIPMLVEMIVKMGERGKEHAISSLAVVYGGAGGETVPAPDQLARVVMLALQGECSARGRRKGTQLLKALQENGRLDLSEEGR